MSLRIWAIFYASAGASCRSRRETVESCSICKELVRLGSVSLHKGTLQRAFVNLLQRALDAMPQAVPLPYGAGATASHSVVEIRDTGSAISARAV